MNTVSKIKSLGWLTAFLTAGSALAAPTHPTFGTFVNAGEVPLGSRLVLEITYTVVNDLDSGFNGDWAVDNYNKAVQVWQVPDGSFYAIARYAGTWTTGPGALSPENGVTEGAGSGTIQGGYVMTFTATGFTPAYGYLGIKDFGGDSSSFGSGSPPPNVFDWVDSYFTGADNFSQQPWGWTYHYHNQTWYNYLTGSGGDIVVP